MEVTHQANCGGVEKLLNFYVAITRASGFRASFFFVISELHFGFWSDDSGRSDKYNMFGFPSIAQCIFKANCISNRQEQTF